MMRMSRRHNKWVFDVAINGYLMLQKYGFLMSQEMGFQCRKE